MKPPRLSLIALLLLSACATDRRAPVESRTSAPRSTPTQTELVAEAQPGSHVVKKGDTLYSIALEHGQDYRDLAAWNGLADANRILVGQALRVAPPEGVVVKPLALGEGVEVRSYDPAATSLQVPNRDGDPRGGKLAYSPETWKQVQTDDAARLAATPPVQSTVESVKPTPLPVAGTEKPTDAGAEGLSWSWPVSGGVLASFNDATNKGVDLAGNLGDPVGAAEAGKVVYVGSGLRGYGNLVIIKHNANFLSAYAHNKEVLVKEGQAVQKGQKIALLGSSDADRPKLHFEIRRQGKPVDPLKYLPNR